MIKKVKVSDYRDFDASRSNNGGCYGFWTTYTLSNETELRLGLETEPRYVVLYHTTADFDYCEYCGSWGSCGCDKTPEIATEKQLFAAMREADKNPSDQVWSEALEEVDITPSADWTKIRRRCEDVLRKCGDNRTIFNVARMLNVKTE